MIKRIKEMEARLNRAELCLKNLEEALDQYDAAKEDLRILSEYYSGPLWRQDYEADEAHLLPEDLPRGVLSEDGLYDLLQKYDELKQRLK
ncbi:MAG: DUF4298 domain-containing protein [Stomatobaculum sp.]|nr:DUF4298 domain-containing protein [Stomatobaculum sp.]